MIAAKPDPDSPTVAEAMRSHDWDHYKEAIEQEVISLESNGTWEVIDRPADVHTLALEKKRNGFGDVLKYKARLVARGFTQVHGVDFDETFAPVCDFNTLRRLLSISNRDRWTLTQRTRSHQTF
jgi:hypothetical protein